jgi:uncharacterized protein
MPYIIIIILIFTGVSSPLGAASFDCQKATTDIEKMICDSPQLSRADEKMASAYQNLRRALLEPEREVLLNDQRVWLQERDRVLRTCTEINCEIQFYQVRIQQLAPVETAGFDCRKATTLVEKKICNSTLLSHADGRMTTLYKSLQDELRQNQRQWLEERDMKFNQLRCDLECAWQFYQDRIELLVRYTF